MRKLIRKWLGIEHPERGTNPVEARDILAGSELTLVAYRIDNGYLLRMNNGSLILGTLTYCTDEKDMAEKITAHRAFHKVVGTQDQSRRHTYATSEKTNRF